MKTIVPLTLRLNGADRIALLSHFLALDPEDRRLRFGAAVADEVIGQYVERLDLGRDGLFAVRDDDDGLAAVVHVAIGDSTGELGLSVLPAHRGRGIGGLLFARAVDFLRNRGLSAVRVHCLAENAAMRHLATRYRMQLTFDGSEGEGFLSLRPATPESYFREWLQDQQAAAVEILRQNARLARLAWTLSRS
jgi:GNAT superfamily N-acetyltransferase